MAKVANSNTANKPVTLSHRRSPVGRPRSRLESLAVIQTRIPEPMYRYCKVVQSIRYPSLTEMFEDMLIRFDTERPWEHGLLWRQPKSAISYHDADAMRTGWKQININLKKDLKSKIITTCKTLNISMSAYSYTALYWWIQYVYPQK
ncbi:hypothetical protein [Methylovorus glucosotrophus]|uniref:Uncharacterized protein n=1 Tax=Methylovorus glucosotrophus (strain SIP3-4) TaxID=582744 RepID=C6XER6_METGS|nr:hypothetical protein [Methylovorus glucosotrophus]ACT52123.1 hypothetical protein Msip34_2899 [Methylovorus glucosotrophus SIP3-4]